MQTLKEKTVLLLTYISLFLVECISKTFLFPSFLNSWQEKWRPLLIIMGPSMDVQPFYGSFDTICMKVIKNGQKIKNFFLLKVSKNIF